ncbi:hypothetical protein SBA5_830002 [Candidatus Sulfotelmatomonas gaucii]|uniref:Uncharacterized protein n=1 Tax=Candidatus Sulfuritelmatomonas gaucii TaxID=2043161 RepID=A0A2N9M6R2_9BACT|nr:hypothetical protein SBA5_830002 [Candidatus Sulfotelmatomonas gaucii]
MFSLRCLDTYRTLEVLGRSDPRHSMGKHDQNVFLPGADVNSLFLLSFYARRARGAAHSTLKSAENRLRNGTRPPESLCT